jgi:hypothetical protein
MKYDVVVQEHDYQFRLETIEADDVRLVEGCLTFSNLNKSSPLVKMFALGRWVSVEPAK